MGQCVTIEVNSTKNQSKSQIDNHSKKGGDNAGQRVRSSSHKKNKPDKKKQRDESSDEETSEEDAEHGVDKNISIQVCDENFGKHQSPINIVTTCNHPHCAENMINEDYEKHPLRFNYPDIIRECTILNTGHTVQVNIPAHSKCSLYKNGKTYHLKQFHFHTPSEHTIDDKQYEMEMHLVHISEDGEIAVLGFIFTTQQTYNKPSLALSKSRKNLIKQTQSIIMKFQKDHNKSNQDVDDDMNQRPDEEEEDANNNNNDDDDELHTDDEFGDDQKEAVTAGNNNILSQEIETRNRGESVAPGNDFLDQFWEYLPLKKTDTDIPLPKPISFDYLFETSSKHFKKSVETNEIEIDMEIFEYDGSLTTPPFTEGVKWMVSKQTHYINVKQLNKLSSCWGHHSNAREVQEYHGRKVQVRNQSSLRGYFFN